ncbi:glycosyltransferase [Aquidulcibacter sp.]|uniref:glycosyltransferase n=1 Tax=Aquidulcibacter sp. TaxID=2052990 RepID=UPI0025BDB03C|nr:glycosyltransferase [Aquidulcibacter sp.]MCA3695820.1 glycosyltransferase [Aquidulcibacter sp.]
MTPIAETIAFFARRFLVERVLILGGDLNLLPHLPTWVKVDRVSRVEALADIPHSFESTLVVGHHLSRYAEVEDVRRFMDKASETARAILAWDDNVIRESATAGWTKGSADRIWKPYGLGLGFSLYDARLPLAVPSNPEIVIRPILACYNEVDIVVACVESMLRDGSRPIVIDNWSNDGTFEVLRPLADAGKIDLECFPEAGPSRTYDWRHLLARKEQLAAENPDAWIIHQDADEIRLGAFPELTLKQNLWVADNYKANAIDYTVINFRPINNDWVQGKDPDEVFGFFEFGESRDDYTRQIKAWKSNGTRVSLAEQAGHEVRFNSRSVFPYKHLLKHYPLRSDAHAARKLLKDRLPRFSREERAMGWHTHYDTVASQESFLRKAEELVGYEQDAFEKFGGSFATGLPPATDQDTAAIAAAPINAPQVWLPYQGALVIDLPEDRAAAEPIKAALKEVAGLITGKVETVRAIATTAEGQQFARELDLDCDLLNVFEYSEAGGSPTSKSIALAYHLRKVNPSLVFGLDRGGVLAKACTLKSQGLALQDTLFAAFLTGGTKQYLEACGLALHLPIHFEVDHLELEFVSRTDVCLAPTSLIAQNWASRGVDAAKITVALPPSAQRGKARATTTRRIGQLVFFGPQMGIDCENLCTSLPRIVEAAPGVPITFAGPMGNLFGEHSGGYLVRTAAKTHCLLNLTGPVNLDTVLDHFADTNPLFIVPRTGGAEIFVALTLSAAGHNVIVEQASHEPDASLLRAGGGNIIMPSPERNGLADAIINGLTNGVSLQPELEQLHPSQLSAWENWLSALMGQHMTMLRRSPLDLDAPDLPLVTIGIPHFERVHDLMACVQGFLSQSYPKLEIIIVDDGSRSDEARLSLTAVEQAISQRGGKVIRQKNAYLGAARNAAYKAASGEFVIFFDDDDVPVPKMVESLVTAALNRRADIVSGALYFWENGQYPDSYDELKCSSDFPGACPSLAYWRNPFGSASVLVRRDAFDALGGYTTDHGIGWEDYELSARACLSGYVYENVPLPLYLYRINYQGMAATTPTLANGRRIWRTLEKFGSHPALQEVLKAGFFERIWQETQVSKRAWLTTLGERYPLYYRLLHTPYHCWESYDLLVQIARAEGQDELAARLENALQHGQWKVLNAQPMTVSSVKSINLDRLSKTAQALFNMGQQVDGIALILDGLAGADANSQGHKTAQLTLIRMYLLDQRPDTASNLATSLMRSYPDDAEVVYAVMLTAEQVCDAHIAGVAQRAFYDCVADHWRGQMVLNDSIVPTASTEEVLELWANTYGANGHDLVTFSVFPDTVTKPTFERYFGWRSLVPSMVEFKLEADSHGRQLPEEGGVFLHPPEPINGVSVAYFHLASSIQVSGLSAEIQRPDARAGTIEFAILALGEGQNAATFLEDEANQDGVLQGPNRLAVGWQTIPRDGKPTLVAHAEPWSINTGAIAILTRMALGEPNNWFASAYIRRLRFKAS